MRTVSRAPATEPRAPRWTWVAIDDLLRRLRQSVCPHRWTEVWLDRGPIYELCERCHKRRVPEN